MSKKTIVFFSFTTSGHINPTLPVAAELVRRGYKVIYYALPIHKKIIEYAGVEFRSYKKVHELDWRINSNPLDVIKTFLSVTNEETDFLLPNIQKEKPDLIVHDALSLWGKIIAQKLSISAVSLITTLRFTPSVQKKYFKFFIPFLFRLCINIVGVLYAYRQYKKLQKKYQVTLGSLGDVTTNAERCNIMFTSSKFQPSSQSFDSSYKFVGATITKRNISIKNIKKLQKNKKTIYISFGTIYNDDKKLVQACIDALRDSSYQVVIAIGHRFTSADFINIPKNFLIDQHIAQLEILKIADLFITHAGMNSVNESLYFGVPMICIPQMFEQEINAKRVAELGAGIVLHKKTVTKVLLKKAIETILSEEKYHREATSIGTSLKRAGGYKKAAKEIIQYIQEPL